MEKKNFVFQDNDLRIAYLLGIYLTDGYIRRSTDGVRIRLKSIDIDIIQKFVDIIYSYTGKLHSITKQKSDATGKYYHYEAACYNKELCDWLEDVTQKKMFVPDLVYSQSIEWKKEFLAGLLDGDGWCSVSQVRKKNNPNSNPSWWATIGLCGPVDSYIKGMRKFFEHMGIEYSYHDRIPKGGTVLMREYRIQTKSFIENELYFKCDRKSKKADIIKREKIGCKNKIKPFSLRGSTTRDSAPILN